MCATHSAWAFADDEFACLRRDHRRRHCRRCVCRGVCCGGLRVAIVEARMIGGGATAAGMGHLVVMDDSEAQFALTRYSQTLWEEIVKNRARWSTTRMRDDLGRRRR